MRNHFRLPLFSTMAWSSTLLRAASVCGLLGLTVGQSGCQKTQEQTPDAIADMSPPAPDLAGEAAHCAYEPAPVRAASGGPIVAGTVLAGVGEAPLDLPVGTPLGGYTARTQLLGSYNAPDNRRSPHAKAFVPSAGVQTRPLVRALYLKAGTEPVVIVKAELCVAYDRLVFDLERELTKAGLMSARGRVIVAASHTHAGYGTYQGVFHLALGFDRFQEEQYQRLLKSMVTAATMAVTSAAPAKLGAGVWDGWDDKDEIYSDRRGDDNILKGKDGKPVGPHKEQRLLVLRVDDLAGKPLALLNSFPMHGTTSDAENPLASSDSTGHVELALEEQFDSKVLVMHLQGPAGDASPRGRGGLGHCDGNKDLCTDFARMESLGVLAAPRIVDLWKSITTSATAELEVVTRSVKNGRSIRVRGDMVYSPYVPEAEIDGSPAAIFNADGSAKSPITQFNVPNSAALCGDKKPVLPVEGIPGAKGAPYGSCAEVGAASKFIASLLKVDAPEQPNCETTRTTLTALRLGAVPVTRRKLGMGGTPVDEHGSETLLLVTMPGEPVSQLADLLRDRSPAGADRTFVIGYSQGHVGYLLGVENWLLGGYEPSINIYGPLEGEWLMERALDLAKLAMTPEREDAEATGEAAPQPGARFDRLRFVPGTAASVPINRSPLLGPVTEPIPASLYMRLKSSLPVTAQPDPMIKRVTGRATFVFYGGDPEEGTPEVVLQREDPAKPGVFADVLMRSGRPVGSRGRDILLTYTPSPVDAEPGKAAANLWAVEWQAVGWERSERQGLQAALDVPIGRYRFSVKGVSRGGPYSLQSSAFGIDAVRALQVTATLTGSQVKGQVVYPAAKGYRLLQLDGPSDGEVPLAGMVQLRLVSRKDMKELAVVQALGAGGKFDVDAAGLDVSAGLEVWVTDRFLNSGLQNVMK